MGPLEIARVFLKPSNVSRYPAAHVAALKEAMGEFLIINLAVLPS